MEDVKKMCLGDVDESGATFFDCLMICASNKEFVAAFDRLTGYNLSLRGSALDLAIDKSSGRLNDGLAEFINFVFESVFCTFDNEEK